MLLQPLIITFIKVRSQKINGDLMKKLLALTLCTLSLGCIIGVNLETADDTVETWVRSYNDRDTEGMYLTLSEEYISENGGEKEVRASIEETLENAKERDMTYTLTSIGQLMASAGGANQTQQFDIYLVKINTKYTDCNGTEKTEELILNFEIKKEDGRYKIVDYWD